MVTLFSSYPSRGVPTIGYGGGFIEGRIESRSTARGTNRKDGSALRNAMLRCNENIAPCFGVALDPALDLRVPVCLGIIFFAVIPEANMSNTPIARPRHADAGTRLNSFPVARIFEISNMRI
ncbi:MAG: hypothetical protein QM741_14640 [Rudaea sp.]|uniref:hypothetical protein n=1 Tax=Rudaea sp. TaxID=2136325 RepID=UPI0039E4D277